jgi:hypothetical protein
MNQVQFEEDNNEFHIRSRRLFGEPETPTMVRFLLRTGIVKNEKQALYILVGIVIIALAVTIFLIRGGIGGGSGDDYITGVDGQEYTFEEYIELVNQGNDPLDPRNNNQ